MLSVEPLASLPQGPESADSPPQAPCGGGLGSSAGSPGPDNRRCRCSSLGLGCWCRWEWEMQTRGFAGHKEGRNLVSSGNRLSWKNTALGARAASSRSAALSRAALGTPPSHLNPRQSCDVGITTILTFKNKDKTVVEKSSDLPTVV